MAANLALAGALSQWGPTLMAAVMFALAGLAAADNLKLALDPATRPTLAQQLRRALPWSAGLALAQIALLILAQTLLPDSSLLTTFALNYLLFACLLPILWAAGRHHAAAVSMPCPQAPRRPNLTFAVLIALGLALNLFTVLIVDIRPGDLVTDLTKDIPAVTIATLTVWLILNAPWVEELLFRHYLVPVIARLAAPLRQPGLITTLAIVIPATLFAIGHAGHMDPAWPKLMQAFGWGILLGWTRIRLGTPHAIALHLFWNLSAPIFAPFLQAD